MNVYFEYFRITKSTNVFMSPLRIGMLTTKLCDTFKENKVAPAGTNTDLGYIHYPGVDNYVDIHLLINFENLGPLVFPPPPNHHPPIPS